MKEPQNPYFLSYQDFANLTTDEQNILNIKFTAFEEGYNSHKEFSKPKPFSEALPKQHDSIIVYGIFEEAREVDFNKNLLVENNIYLIKQRFYYDTSDSETISYHYTHWKPVDIIDY